MSSDAPGGKDQQSGDLLDLAFDSTGLPPPLRPPALSQLSQAQLLAAIELGFSNKYLPAEISGRVNGNAGSGGGRGNHHQNNYSSNNSSGGQGQRYQGPGHGYSGGYQDSNNHQQQQQQQQSYPNNPNQGNRRANGQQELYRQNGGEELLPPLRRPHLNEIPPDVLAVLLKTARFEEILGPQSQENSTANQQDFHYNQNQDYSRMANRNQQQQDFMPQQQSPQGNPQNPQQPQRQNSHQRGSNPASPQSQHGYSSPNNQSQSRPDFGSGDWNSKKSVLSPFAKEFQPKTMSPQIQSQAQAVGMAYSQEEADLAQAVAQFQMMGTTTEFGDDPYSGQSSLTEDNTDCILTVVTDSINEMSSHPANFNRCAKAIHEVLKNYVVDAETLFVVVTLIIEQSISNPNFYYSGARLAQYLISEGVTAGTTMFKTQFLTRLQEEFTGCVNLMETNPDIIPRCRGLLSFFGELYMNIRIVKSGVAQPLDVLGLGVSEMMQKLVKDPTHDNIKCVFQAVKLVGWEIEKHGSTKLQEEFEKTMKDLSYISMSDKNLKPQTKLLLDTLFELRRKEWNRGPVEEEVNSSGASTASSSSVKGTDIYELPESDEEDFDDTCLMIDDEPEEVQKAFEDFLKMSHK